MQLCAVNIFESTNEYYQKFFLKSLHKMALYPAMMKTNVAKITSYTLTMLQNKTNWFPPLFLV